MNQREIQYRRDQRKIERENIKSLDQILNDISKLDDTNKRLVYRMLKMEIEN